MENNIGIPQIPKHNKNIKQIKPPDLNQKKVNNMDEFEHFWQFILFILAKGIRNLPKLLLTVVLPLVIVTVINIILESIPNYTLYGFTKTVVLLLVFLTATYNSFIPRTIFWVIVFTIGKSLFRRVRSEGFVKVSGDFRQFPVRFKASKTILGKLSNNLLITGAGLGFVAANFLSRNNKIDKVLVCYVVAIALVNALSKGKEGLLFVSIKLIYKDLTVFNKNKRGSIEHHIYIVVSGFALGLIGNTIFAVIALSYGGYILGAILTVLGLAMMFLKKNEVKENQS